MQNYLVLQRFHPHGVILEKSSNAMYLKSQGKIHFGKGLSMTGIVIGAGARVREGGSWAARERGWGEAREWGAGARVGRARGRGAGGASGALSDVAIEDTLKVQV